MMLLYDGVLGPTSCEAWPWYDPFTEIRVQTERRMSGLGGTHIPYSRTPSAYNAHRQRGIPDQDMYGHSQHVAFVRLKSYHDTEPVAVSVGSQLF